MKKRSVFITFLVGIMLLSCASDGEDPQTTTKLVKQITDNEGYWTKFYYDEQENVNLITRTSNQVDYDSTYFEYTNGILSRTLQRIYVPVTGIVNTEVVFSQFSSSLAKGTYHIFLDNGTIFQDKTFEYTLDNNLIKSIIFFNLDGSKSQEKIYSHDAEGNLNQWRELWYNTDGTIQTQRDYEVTGWDTQGRKTLSLLYWHYKISNMPSTYFSNSNCTSYTHNGDNYTFSFEYDEEGYVSKYNYLEEQKSLSIEYYEE